RALLETARPQGIQMETSAVSTAGVSAIGASNGLRAFIGSGAFLIRFCIEIVLLVFQDGHARVWVLLCKAHIRLRELPQKSRLLGSFLKLIVCINRHSFLLIARFRNSSPLSYCRASTFLSPPA